jgi:hypothetical protein
MMEQEKAPSAVISVATTAIVATATATATTAESRLLVPVALQSQQP